MPPLSLNVFMQTLTLEKLIEENNINSLVSYKLEPGKDFHRIAGANRKYWRMFLYKARKLYEWCKVEDLPAPEWYEGPHGTLINLSPIPFDNSKEVPELFILKPISIVLDKGPVVSIHFCRVRKDGDDSFYCHNHGVSMNLDELKDHVKKHKVKLFIPLKQGGKIYKARFISETSSLDILN